MGWGHRVRMEVLRRSADDDEDDQVLCPRAVPV